jgi:hypothetical protein
MEIMTRFFHNRGVAPNSRLEAATQSAAQPSRYANGPEISLSVKFVDGTRIRVGSDQG